MLLVVSTLVAPHVSSLGQDDGCGGRDVYLLHFVVMQIYFSEIFPLFSDADHHRVAGETLPRSHSQFLRLPRRRGGGAEQRCFSSF